MTGTPFDLDAYFRRIDYSGERAPTLEVLGAISERHALSMAFENLDILLGRPIRLDAEALQDKLVTRRRGGYCFEHNTLLAGVLSQLGFDVRALAARARWMVPQGVIMPRTHMLLSVGLGRGAGADRERPDREGDGACEHGRAEDETRYLVDGGFGGIGLTAPLRIGDPAEQPSLFEPQRIATVPEGRLLQARVNGEWRDLYVFGDGPQEAIDFEVANWFTSTHPDSRFKRNLIVSLASPTIRHVLFNRELSAYRTGGVERSSIDDPEQLLEVLESVFHLSFPARTRFGDAGAPWAR